MTNSNEKMMNITEAEELRRDVIDLMEENKKLKEELEKYKEVVAKTIQILI